MPASNTQSVLIIGYGNPIYKDDGLGWRVIEELERNPQFLGHELHACHQLTPELADAISRSKRVIFVDASNTVAPGNLFCNEVTAELDQTCYTHTLTPRTLLGFTQELYGVCPPGWILGLGAESFDLGEDISQTISAAIPELIAKISELCQ